MFHTLFYIFPDCTNEEVLQELKSVQEAKHQASGTLKYVFVNVLSFSCQPKADYTSFVEFARTLGSIKDREQFATSLRKMQHHHLMVGEFNNVSLSGPGPQIKKFDECTCRFCKTSFDDREQLETHMKQRELMNILYKVQNIFCSDCLLAIISS